MPALSTPVASACVSALFLLGTLSAQTPSEPVATSQVRIVRLSQVKGVVQLDRNTGRGFEPAIANLPIVEHSRLETGMGIAEVEFEDNSTLRIAPGSLVEFTQLGRLPQGTTISSVRLVRGTAYVSLLKTKTRGPEFNLLVGQQKLQLPAASHIRLQTDGSVATLAVLDGTVHLDESAGPTDVPHKNTVTFHLQEQAEPTVAKNIVPAAMDAWDKNSAQAHSQSASTTAFGSPYAYGLGDMMYYGAFTSAGGCGSMWRPYFASAAWDPYSNGVWAWYQGAGYSWVSPYPWGWTPYHFGNWSYCSGAGWGWQPGGSWNGLNNVIAVVPTGGGGAAGTHPRPPRPVRPPAPGTPTLTAFNRTSLVRSEVSGDSFVFRKDSAGLGIPRDGLGRLGKFSQNTLTRGTASTPVYVSPPSSYAGNERPGNERPGNGRPANGPSGQTSGGVAPASIHRGSAPPPEPQRQSQSSGWGGNGGGNGGGGNSARSGPEPSSQGARSAPSPASPPAAAPAANSGASHPH